MYVLVVCSLERTHDSDPVPAIVITITTPAKSEPARSLNDSG